MEMQQTSIYFIWLLSQFQSESLLMSQFYRSSNFNYSSLLQQSPGASQDTNRQMNKTFGPEAPQIHRVFSPRNNQQSMYFLPQQPKVYESPHASQYIRPPSSSFNTTHHPQRQQISNKETFKETFLEATKLFMSEMTKSIAEITKAQVQAIMKEKQSQSNINSINKTDEENKLINPKNEDKESKSFSRGFSIQQPIKEKKQNGAEKKVGAEIEEEPNSVSLRNNSINEQNTGISGQGTEILKLELKQLVKEIRGLRQNRKQSRSIWLDVDLERVTETSKRGRTHELKKMAFKIIEDVLSVSFNMHYRDGVQFEKVKAYCCENFIINFCKLVKMAKITAKEMKIIEDQLQEEVLPYLNLSYPRSEQKVSNKELKNKISEKDIFNENRFDIVYNSKVQLSTKQSETNSEIMKIMNYIIKLPDERVPQIPPELADKSEFSILQPLLLHETEEKTLYEHFQRDMETMFTKVYKKELTDKLYKLCAKQESFIKSRINNKKYFSAEELMRKLDEEILSPKLDQFRKKQKQGHKIDTQTDKIIETVSKYILSGIKEDTSKPNTLSQEQEKQRQQQYKEKVQSYTKFKIGRKISPNVEPYTEEQIDEGVLFIKDSSVARVLMKWVEAIEGQIKDPVKSLYLRDEPFRLHNSQETYLLSIEQKIKQLYQLYKRSAKVIEEKSEDLKNNARQIFLQALKSCEESQRFKPYREFSSENEALVGHISTTLLKSRENHVSSYLNMLLGEIKYIEQEYQWKIEDKKIDLNSGPSLINMKLGDLMRCQITSKPKEIIALYQYISLLCKSDPNKFQLVRVKDRLSTPNKDILINIFYHQKIMIEIQLAIKNESAFISCSDSFSHFIYELIRAFLGPINELCSIWSQYSPKAEFFVQKFTELNIRGKPPPRDQGGCSHSYEDDEKYLKLPFTCNTCGVLYYNSSTSRKQCTNCKVYECCVCNIKQNELEYIQRQYPEYQIKKERKIGEIFYALDILTNSKHIKTMFELEINGKLEAYSMKLQPNEDKKNPRPIISSIKSEYELNKRKKVNLKRSIFEQSHIILQKKNPTRRQQDTKLVDEVIKQILNSYYLPRRTKVIINKSQSFMKLTLITNPKIKSTTKGEIITNIINKNAKFLVLIEKLNLNQNGLSDLKIAGKMPNARNMVLNHNQLSTLDLLGFKNLVTLELAHNEIGSLRSLCLSECVSLKRLILDDNKILSVDGLPAQLVLLECLSLSKNKIKFLKNMPCYKNLKSLNLNENELIDLTGIQKLPTLEELRLKKNIGLATSGVQLLKELKLLKKLDLNQTNLRKAILQSDMLLKDSSSLKNVNSENGPIYEPLLAIKSLTQLESLDGSFNSLSFIPKIPELSKLKELNLSKNNLKDTQNLQNFVNLKWLCLKENQISQIKSLVALKNLFWLDLSRNQLCSKDLPIISHLKNLHQIELSHNKLVTLEGIGSLPKLYELSCRSNKLSSLRGLQKLYSLQHLDARNNREICEVTGIENLKVLFELKLSGNRIKNLNTLKKVQSLKILELNSCELHHMKVIPQLKNLQELYLNKNSIQSFQGIANFSSLKKLEILQNDITINEHDLESLSNLSQIAFTLTNKIEIEFIANTQSLEVIRIQQVGQPTKTQSDNLVALSLLGYNIQFLELEQQPDEAESLNESELYESNKH